MRKKRRERLNWFPPTEAALKRTLIHHIILVLLGSRPPCVSPFACNGGNDSLWYLNCSPQLRFTFFPFLFSQLLHALDWHLEDNQEPGTIYTSYGPWSKEESALSCPIEEYEDPLPLLSLPQLQRPWFRRHLFCFLFKENEKTWNFCRVLRLVGVEDGPLRVPYIEGEIWGNTSRIKLKEGMSSKINFPQFLRESSTSKSVSLHKGAIEYTFRIPKQFALFPKRKHSWQCTSHAEALGACHG